MQNLDQDFQPIHQARTRAAGEVVVEGIDLTVLDRIQGVPAGARLHCLDGDAVSRISQQDHLRVFPEKAVPHSIRGTLYAHAEAVGAFGLAAGGPCSG